LKFLLHPQGCTAFWADFTTSNPPHAAGIMAMWSLAGWWHARGASGFAAVLWTILLALFLLGQCIFLRRIANTIRSAPASAHCISTLWQKMEPPWIVPLVGVCASSAAGGDITRWVVQSLSWPHAVLDWVRFAPVALGGFWAAVIVLPLWVKAASTGTIWTSPPCAILMASAGIVLAGWLAATSGPASYAHEGLRTSAPTHILAVLVAVTGAPIVLLAPRYLDPRRPFTPAVATVGFPMEIGAIAMLRYSAIAKAQSGGDSAHARIALIGAWVGLIACTTAAATIIARYAVEFAKSVRAAPPPDVSTERKGEEGVTAAVDVVAV